MLTTIPDAMKPPVNNRKKPQAMPRHPGRLGGSTLHNMVIFISCLGLHTGSCATPEAELQAAVEGPQIRIEHAQKDSAIDPALLSAWQAYRSGKLDIAGQRYGEILHEDRQHHRPPSRDALLGMAAVAQQRAQNDLAAEYYGRVLALDPRDPDARAGMFSLLGESRAAGAGSRLKHLLSQHPEAAILYLALGNFHAAHSHWGKAQQAYFSACELDAGNAGFAFNLAVSLDHLGQGNLAAQHYRRALQLDNPAIPSFDHTQASMRLKELTAH